MTTPKEEENNTLMEQFVSDYDDYESKEHDTNLTSHDRAKMYELLRKFRREAIAETLNTVYEVLEDQWNPKDGAGVNIPVFKSLLKERGIHLTQE